MTTVGNSTVRFRMNTLPIQAMFRVAPDTLWKHYRDKGAAKTAFQFRKRFLAMTQVNPASGSARAMAPVASFIPDRNKRNTRRVWFVILPRNRSRVAGQLLEDVQLHVFTYSEVHLGLEQGGTFRPRGGDKYIRLPVGRALDSRGRVKRRYGPQQDFSRSSARRKKHVVLKNRRGTLVLYEKVGRAAKGQRQQLEPIAVLVKQVRRRQSLHLMQAWDATQSDLRRNLSAVLDATMAELGGKRRG